MINPDLHINIYVSSEVVQMICLTVGFAIAMWTYIKILSIWKQYKLKEENDND